MKANMEGDFFMIGMSKDTFTNLTTNETTDEVYLRLYLSAFKSGLLKELKPTNSMVLLAICSFMNEEGECYPTQEQIAERVGVSKPTVNKSINDLLKFEFNGKPLISREIIQKGYFKNSFYKVNPITQVAIFGSEVETVSTKVSTDTSTSSEAKFKVAKDVGQVYMNVYQEVYGVQPNIVYARDYTQVKNKWLGKFTDSQIETMIQTGVREYDKRWKGPKFPRPSLSALVSWIGEQALGLASDNDKEFKEVSEINSDYVAVNDKALNRLANRLNR
ncbi:helix-turn-helix domain-containing protein [Peribacillus muralis]|uniref:helix-turn-helix domain-containing protein n=1 Tax=Peribacillus muralis TaxID=264697 RepID=UPI003670E3BF